jgi:hypothetical protein
MVACEVFVGRAKSRGAGFSEDWADLAGCVVYRIVGLSVVLFEILEYAERCRSRARSDLYNLDLVPRLALLDHMVRQGISVPRLEDLGRREKRVLRILGPQRALELIDSLDVVVFKLILDSSKLMPLLAEVPFR